MSFWGLASRSKRQNILVVVIDSLGNDISLSPSNAGPHSLAFPRFTALSVWDRQREDSKVNLRSGRSGWAAHNWPVFS